MECASAFTGQPILDLNGKPLPWKYPWACKNLTLWTIGLNQRHIGQTLHRLLFEKGFFKLLKQPDGNYVVFNERLHAGLEHQIVESEPAIPERFIQGGYLEGLKYEDLGKRVVEEAHGTNGNTMFFFASTGEVKQGDDVHYMWVDEDIARPTHVGEWKNRFKVVRGRFVWSATPMMKNNELRNMSLEAEQDSDKEKPDYAKFRMRARDNPAIPDDQHDIHMRGLSDDEIRARDEGEFTYDSVQVYHQFDPKLHGVPQEVPKGELETDRVSLYFKQFKMLPLDWTRYLIIDPGQVVTAALFFAVPKPDDGYGNIVVLEEELYLRRKTFDEFAREVKRVMAGRQYESFVMDMHAGKQKHAGQIHSTADLYRAAFDRLGIRSKQTLSGFEPGCDNTEARELQFRTWLSPMFQDGKVIGPKFRYLTDRIRNFVREIQELRTDKFGKRQKSDDHTIDCVEYAAGHGLPYVRVQNLTKHLNLLEEHQRLFGERRTVGINLGPTLSGAA
jgi:hypothetical protein